MKRTDRKIENNTFIVHPAKLKNMRQGIRADFGADGLSALRDSVINEELEIYVEQIVADEMAEEIRTEIRAMLAAK